MINDQLPLLPDPQRPHPPAARTGDRDTALAAALDPHRVRGRLRLVVLHVHSRHPGGLTDDECWQLTRRQLIFNSGDDDTRFRKADALHPGSVAKRRQELELDGWIFDSGQRRPTRSGRPAIVWRITAEGLVAWQTRMAT